MTRENPNNFFESGEQAEQAGFDIKKNKLVDSEADERRLILEKIFPDKLPTLEDLEMKYPARDLAQGAKVTRIAPSPTGFMHIGSLYTAMVSERFAHQTEGVFYLRIEDTDRKREVEGAAELIPKSLKRYGINFDEGLDGSGKELGGYGPYKQSERGDIYRSTVKNLVEKGLAYPCFCTAEELDEMRALQEQQGIRPGYYRQWAKWRDKSSQDVLQAMSEGRPYVIRFKSGGDFNNKIKVHDEILGDRELSENDQDIVIMKSDGLPTYHLAHVVDDHLMKTTDVLRGDEWLSSLPLHLQLFGALEWKPPRYGHIAPIQKMEGNSKRKLSKRKDPEANVNYYGEQGYPETAIVEYLLNLANSNFEDWRKASPNSDAKEFKLTIDKLKKSNGAIFDFNKLRDISREVIARYSAVEAYSNALAWAKNYDPEFGAVLETVPEYSVKVFSVERGGEKKVRKDITKWSEAKQEIGFFFDQFFSVSKDAVREKLPGFDDDSINKMVELFMGNYNSTDSRDAWFDKIKLLARENGYADNAKEYKANPGKYKGNVADVAKIFRVLLTGKEQSPDLFSIMQVMGKERVAKRLSLFGDR
jgi:glutamyl-tRNA synthetase